MSKTLMKPIFHEEFTKLMRKDEKVVFIDADLAKAHGSEKLRLEFPDRALDVGIAEQMMVEYAAGLSAYGLKPYVATFTPFLTRRACDQIAISVCYAKRNVKLIGTDPGICAETNGGTHMGMEDIGVMRSIPTMVIYEPADAAEFIKALPVINDYPHAMYIRHQRTEAQDVHEGDFEFDLFKAELLKEGADVTIAASGYMVAEAQKAADILAKDGINAEILNVHTIKPLDGETIAASVKKTGCLVTAENHNIIGGLRSAILEDFSERGVFVPTEAIGVKDHFGEVGFLPFLQEKYHMRPEDIAEAAKKVIAKK